MFVSITKSSGTENAARRAALIVAWQLVISSHLAKPDAISTRELYFRCRRGKDKLNQSKKYVACPSRVL